MGSGNRVVVNVDHPGVRHSLLDDLVHIAHSGQARAEVDELPDLGLGGQEPHRPLEERPALPRQRHGPRLR